jgi:hypothetical protein
VFDVDNDGHLDIVSGAYWYPGPDFDHKCPIAPARPHGEYFDDFSTIALDVNGDGYLDVITGGWFGKELRWLENPEGSREREWQEHTVATCGSIETTRAWDIDGDGELEIVPNTPNDPQRAYKLVRDAQGQPTGQFAEFLLSSKVSGHGLGFGDVDGDGRGELVLCDGWLKPPTNPLDEEWEFVPGPDLALASIPILVVDVDGDGANELIVGHAHDFGLDWWKRTGAGAGDWTRHPIDPFNSQYHDLVWADIDGDGESELITGKRYRAHNGRDPGEYDPYGIYYFKWTGEGFAKQIVCFGEARSTTGTGISFAVADLDSSGRLDVIAAGKDGLYLFENLGPARSMEPSPTPAPH